MKGSWYVNCHCLLVMAIVLWGGYASAELDVLDIWKNNEAVELQKNKKATESFDAFATLLGRSPFHPVFQFNMGTGFFVTEDMDKAKKLFEGMADQKALHPSLAFPVNFNLGALYGAEKDVDGALERYQAALAMDPTNVQVKTNIELLIQQKKGGGGGKNDKDKKKGKGDSKDKGKSDKDEDEEEDGEKKKGPMKNQNPGYKGKDMSKEDVQKILKELKNQEQKIRAKHDRKGKKEKDRGKNW